MPKLSILIPIFNEEEIIPELYRRLKGAIDKDFSDFEYEFLFVDDGSSDRSFELLQELHEKNKNIKIIQFSRNFGHHIAITAGLDHVEGDFVVMMDGDLQDQPEEIRKLYDKLGEGYEVVYGERKNKKFSVTKRALSSLFNFVMRVLVRERFVINSNIFRIMTSQVVESLVKIREQNRYIVGIIGWVGFRHGKVAVEHGERFAGVTKYNLSKQFALAFNAIFSFSDAFLKFIIKLGFFLIFSSLLMVVYVLYNFLTDETTVAIWASLVMAFLLIGGIQIIILGVIGEYVGRTYKEVKNRPLYVIKKYVNG